MMKIPKLFQESGPNPASNSRQEPKSGPSHYEHCVIICLSYKILDMKCQIKEIEIDI